MKRRQSPPIRAPIALPADLRGVPGKRVRAAEWGWPMLAAMDSVQLSPGGTAPPDRAVPERSAGRRPRRRWGRTVLMVLLALYVLAALAIAWSRWGLLDPQVSSQAREIADIVLPPDEHPWYYPMLWLHVFTSSVALTASVFQIWPWLRRTHPAVHRNVGRIYVFAGVFPSVITALIVQAFWAFSMPTAISQIVPLVLWFAVTAYGLVLRRRGWISEHRRWMLRSFALTALVLMELTIDPFVQLLIATQFESRLHGSMDIYMQMKDTTENWLGLVLTILIVEGRLEYERRRDMRRAAEAAGTTAVPAPPVAP
jgi:uncharacterized membrane protein